MTADIDRYRRRYQELKDAARTFTLVALPPLSDPASLPLAPDVMRWQETLPGGWGWARRLAKGEVLRIINSEGAASVALTAWNARDSSERFNAPDTVKVQWTADLRKGRILLSDMGRAMLSIVEDSYGHHDAIAGVSSPFSNCRNYGDTSLRNSRENFVLAAAKHGLARADIGSAISLFAPIATNAQGRIGWTGPCAKPGDLIDLRAEIDLLVALSNCPHPLDPGKSFAPPPVDIIVYRPVETAGDDLCRRASPEAVRAFENTDRYLASMGA